MLGAVPKEMVGVEQFFRRAAKTFSYGHAVDRKLEGVPQPLTRLRSAALEVDQLQTAIVEREDSVDPSSYRTSPEGKGECLLEEDRARIETRLEEAVEHFQRLWSRVRLEQRGLCEVSRDQGMDVGPERHGRG